MLSREFDPEPYERFDYGTPKKYSSNAKRINEAGKIENAEIIVLECSNCRKSLATIWVIRPTSKVTSHIIAHCCFCGDKSFKRSVIGGICIGDTDITSILDFPSDITEKEGHVIQNINIKTGKKI
jgi:hypothetical protein